MFSKIEGLNPPAGTISTSSYAGMDGSYFNNAFIEKRNVVIPFEMRGLGIEKRRHEIYKVVKPSRYRSLLSVALFGCIFSIVNYLVIIALTQFFFQNQRFNTFSIYEILPQLIELWGLNTDAQVDSKKTSHD